ncbi:ATP-dependent endonuclease (plasmid) [Sinorhizobium meliloti]|uniref:ATP-dependent nuclease n=1 Tax=Rhizobium meliloti TaxID=382 RepID=UPI00299D9207|nr:AAA family ATPase [Sinorhizobium meliloti]MDW9997614.1 AAA family ATPase [Sinorhizobium meliloti]
MQLHKISVKNFRLLHDVEVLLEPRTTVIVGRNNCGKTSLTEVVKRLLHDKTAVFRLEDFAFCCHNKFWEAFLAFKNAAEEQDVRLLLPSIEIKLSFTYGPADPLGLLSEFVIDLDPDCSEAVVVGRYTLKPAMMTSLFANLEDTEATGKDELFRLLRERIPNLFGLDLFAVDPNDATNTKAIELSLLRSLAASGFISAQRGLDDESKEDRVVIGKVLENLFMTAKNNPADAASHEMAKELEGAVHEIQDKIGTDFNSKLNALMPALSLFGHYPTAGDSTLLTETTLNVDKLLTNHTRVRYSGVNGIHLPEAYNGLGARNIILILLQLRQFFKQYLAMEPKPAVQVVFIEEPEVHLHPQMQEVFIRKLSEIADLFGEEHKLLWPAQFVVSTHSSHVANEARFDAIRYFLAKLDAEHGSLKTTIKDLRKGLTGKGTPEEQEFLHQYMTLTRCDLFFADNAILIEGTTERLLLPKIIEMIDVGRPAGKKLKSQYLSIMEVGGAYAHIFFDLLDFLELRTLIVTDLDSVRQNDAKKWVGCPVHLGSTTSNACLKSWFHAEVTPDQLLLVPDEYKIVDKKRIAYQIPEADGLACGRSFEDAFMLANTALFPLVGTETEKAQTAWDNAKDEKKSEFALRHALRVENWTVPRYIREGIVWLAEPDTPPLIVAAEAAPADIAA